MTEPERFQFESTDGLSVGVREVGSVRRAPYRGVQFKSPMDSANTSAAMQSYSDLVRGRISFLSKRSPRSRPAAKPSTEPSVFGFVGFNQLVEDMVSLRVIGKQEHPGKPYIFWATAWARSLRNNCARPRSFHRRPGTVRFRHARRLGSHCSVDIARGGPFENDERCV